MSGGAIGLAGFIVLLALLALRLPVAVALIVVGGIGHVVVSGSTTAILAHLETALFYQVSTYALSVVPLFLLMGQLAARSGLAAALFRLGAAGVGHYPGGLGMAAIAACAGFGAICGSSLATAATMGQTALPELRRQGYRGAFAAAILAAGGTLGILIPPSVPLVIYALMTEQNIARLFLCAVVPGLLAAAGYAAVVALVVRIRPALGPAVAVQPWRTRMAAAAGALPVLAVFLLVVGGILDGWFTPTEGAAVGTFATGLLAVGQGLRWAGFLACLRETATTSALIFLILFGAELFNAFLALTGLTAAAAGVLTELAPSPWLVVAGILILYLILGCVMDSLSMLILTIPVFFPIVLGLDLGLSGEETGLWFGILAVTAVEIGLITPPVGLNVFVIAALTRDVPMFAIFRAVLPFLASDLVRLTLLATVPGISLIAVRWLG